VKLWPHQTYALTEVRRLIDAGERRICVTAPTGAGKSHVQREICDWGYRTLLLCNRTMLLEQHALGMTGAGVPFGMQASGYAPTISENVQLGMVQTINSRMGRGAKLPDCDIIILDEAHNEKGERSCAMLNENYDRGGINILFTATPVGLSGMADKLVVAGKTSDMFKCGALIPAHTYAPDEPSMKVYKSIVKGVMQLRDECRGKMLTTIWGRVLDQYRILNPDQKPGILFAPDVGASRYFCEEFNKAGIPASHIDAEQIVLNGDTLSPSRENRAALLEASRTGETKVICNRFVMREGIDAPWLHHGILACTFGSIASYIQAGGRLLRSFPGMDHVVLQDHGGNFWRSGSLNSDIAWSLEDTDQSIKEQHDEKHRSKSEPEPIVCPKCFKVRTSGKTCPHCGFSYPKRVRNVIQTDGTLRPMHGDVYKPKKVSTAPDAHKKWLQCVYRCKATGKTFNQAKGLFQLENNWQVPGPDFPMQPKRAGDWGSKISDIPRGDLT
jgi:DNA repair protein RadD